MEKHTEGPWEVGDLVENDYEPRYVEVLGNDGVKHIAKAVYGQTDEEAATNAHLIAAAPELLEACRTVYNKLIELEQDAGRNLFITDVLDILEKATNKAEGIKN